MEDGWREEADEMRVKRERIKGVVLLPTTNKTGRLFCFSPPLSQTHTHTQMKAPD